jgi:hypothetical protein
VKGKDEEINVYVVSSVTKEYKMWAREKKIWLAAFLLFVEKNQTDAKGGS